VKSPRALLIVPVVCAIAAAATAEPAAFTLDPAASTLTVSGTLLGQPFVAQNPGSLTTGYTGTFFVDLDGGRVLLTSDVPNAVNQPLPQQPGQNTTDAQPANYGMRGTLGTDTLLAAIRQLDLSINGEFNPPALSPGGTFDPTAIGTYINGGSLYYSTGTTSNYVDLHGTGAPNTATAPGTLTTVGNVQTLTFPLRLTGTRDVLGPGDTVLVFDGQLVATRIVPEPGACALALGAGAALLRRRRTA